MISKSEIRFAARLVHLGLVSKEDMQAVLSDLNRNRDSRLDSSLDEILVERGHVTKTEIPLIKEKEESDEPFPAVRVEGYTVKEMLGEGGMSRVYRAVERGAPRSVALKILRPHIARTSIHLRRFYREAELLIQFSNPNLVKGYAVWESDGLHCFTMEFVDGVAIQEEIERGRRFEEDQVLSVILQAARALVYLSEQGITHRDIKPGNLLLGPDGVVKLIDLGLALESFQSGDDEQREGTTVGTVQYVSPEQARGEALDVRADIYSLGVSLYHMVTGDVPFEGESDREILRQQIYASLKSPRAKDRRITPHLHYFMEKMMAKDRALRYQNAEELIVDIEEKIQGREEIMLKSTRPAARTLERPSVTEEKPFAPPDRGKRPASSARSRRRRRRGRFGR